LRKAEAARDNGGLRGIFFSARLFVMSFRRLIFVVLLLVAPVAYAEITLPGVWSDHAVVQRARPLHLWGLARPGARLAIHFHEQSGEAVVDETGAWSVWLKPELAGGPFILQIEGDGAVTRTDLLVGDVWLASGQSNMQFPLRGFDGAPLKDGEKEIAAATVPNLRLLLVPRVGSDTPKDDVHAGWTACTPQTAREFSAVAYFFGRAIAEKEHVPVGLIDASWGGTPADAWTSLETLASDPALLPAFAARAQFALGESRRQRIAAIEREQDAALRAAGKPVTLHEWKPDEVSWTPAALYNGMIAPLTPYSIKGFLWYQGETNSRPERYRNYAALFPALIRDWRARFAQGELPFVYAQISSFDSPAEHWGVIRDAQRRALALRATAQAVTLDVGEKHNVHPADKQTVAARLAMAARGLSYGESMEYASPTLRQVTREPGALRLWFDHAAGLHARGTLRDFEVAGADGRFVPAEARIEGETVVVSSPEVTVPVDARYAWANDATGSLANGAGLPAGTFTTEETPRE
jgi:sialate O-acetylesterase